MSRGLSVTVVALGVLAGSAAALSRPAVRPPHTRFAAVRAATTPPSVSPPLLFQSGAPAPGSPAEQRAFARKSLEELNADQPLADVLFDSNRATVRDDARATLQKNAEWLKKWGTTAVTIEGHCDSRGTPAYNVALGTSRASAIKEYLITLGIAPSRVTIVGTGRSQSFCDEQDVVDQLEPPFPGCVACHLERCWQENRRGHFIITAK